MICPHCNAACEENTAVCNACGGALQEKMSKVEELKQKVTPYLEKYLEAMKEYWSLVMVAVSALAVVMGVLNLFCLLKVYQVTEVTDVDRGFVLISEATKNLKIMGGSFAVGIIGNILYGLICLVIGAAGVLYFLKKYRNMPYYDQFIGKYIKTAEPAFLMGVAGVGATVLQVISYLLCCISRKDPFTRVVVGVHWLTWVMFLVFGVFAATAFLLKKKEQ